MVVEGACCGHLVPPLPPQASQSFEKNLYLRLSMGVNFIILVESQFCLLIGSMAGKGAMQSMTRNVGFRAGRPEFECCLHHFLDV